MLLGLTVTLAVVAAHVARLERPMEQRALDLRCALRPAETPDAKIVRVTIDQTADLARLVDTLRHCRAEIIVLDLPLDQPRPPRYSDPIARPDDRDFPRLLARRSPEMIFDDARLADAIRRHGNVLLSVRANLSQPIRSPLQEAVESALRARPGRSAQEVADTIEGHDTIDPDLLARAKQRAIEQRVAQVLEADARRSLDAVRDVLRYPNRGPTPEECEMVRRAYLRARGLAALHPFDAEGVAESFPVAAARADPPLVTFLRAAQGEGLVAATEDDDGTVRRISLLGRTDERILPHLALAVACRRLAPTGQTVRIDAKNAWLTIRMPDGSRRVIPADADGRMLIRWTSRGRDDLTTISAAELAAAWPQPRATRRDRALARRLSLRAAELLDTTVAKSLAERIRQAQLARLPDARRLRRAAATLYDPANVADAPQTQPALAAIEDEIDKLCLRVRELLADDSWPIRQLRRQAQPTRDIRPDAGAADLRAIHHARRQLEELKTIHGELARLRPRAPKTQPAVVNRRSRLRERIEGRICWVMSTSPGETDHVATPLAGRMPLAEVNARAAETILAGTLIRTASQQDNLVVIVLAGVVASFLASMFRPLAAATVTLVLGGAYTAFNAAVILNVWHVWMVLVAPLAAMLLCLVCVAMLRRAVEGGARRQVRETFAETMGAEAIERLIPTSHRIRLDGQKHLLTCLRCNFDGMEGLWSQLGPSRTAALLQRYLLPLRRLLQDNWDAHVRTIGAEGLLAVFGWPIEYADHATRAVQAAVDCRLEADHVAESVQRELGAAETVRCHIGLATGEMIVTDIGDTSRIACAVLGAAADHARRLASANRNFGSTVLACGETWRMVERTDLLARPLGPVQLTAHAAATRTWDVHPGPAGASRVEAYDDFARAVNLFARRKFQAAAEIFEHVAATLANDAPARIYLARCRACLAAPPDDNWNPAIRLTEL